MNVLYIGEEKYKTYLNDYEYVYLIDHYPLSTFEIKEALRIYLENECHKIIGIGSREIRDFVKVLGLIGENNYSWKELFFNPNAITSYPEVIFWADDLASFKKEDTAYICDFNCMEMIGVKRGIFKDVPIGLKEDIFTTREDRIISLLIAVEEGLSNLDISVATSYISGDFNTYSALSKNINTGEGNPILKCLFYLLPYGNNSYKDFIAFYRDLIIKYSEKENEFKKLYAEIQLKSLGIERELLKEDQMKLMYLMKEKEMLNNEIVEEIFRELEK